MPRYRIDLSYLGTRYHGWQKQPKADTVQGRLETQLARILNLSEVATTGAGRTDAGVHADHQVCHFDLEAPLAEPTDLAFRLNRLLPGDIRIHALTEAVPDFHARYGARSRRYRYELRWLERAAWHQRAWHLPTEPDLDRMRSAAERFLGTHGFADFARGGHLLQNDRCTVTAITWEPHADGGGISFRISADRFLHSMVRRIVGDLVGGKPKPAPPEGLWLEEVVY